MKTDQLALLFGSIYLFTLGIVMLVVIHPKLAKWEPKPGRRAEKTNIRLGLPPNHVHITLRLWNKYLPYGATFLIVTSAAMAIGFIFSII